MFIITDSMAMLDGYIGGWGVTSPLVFDQVVCTHDVRIRVAVFGPPAPY